MATITRARRILLFPIDLVLYPLAWTYEATLSLPSYQRLVNVLVEASTDIVARVLLHPAVSNAIAAAITEGMNKFLRQPNLDEHVKVMMDTMSDMQPEIARKKGEEFHNSIANFIQGMINPRREENGASETQKPAAPAKFEASSSFSSPPSEAPAGTKSASSSSCPPDKQGANADNNDLTDGTMER